MSTSTHGSFADAGDDAADAVACRAGCSPHAGRRSRGPAPAACSRSAPRSTEPANSASSSASCEARRASRVRLAAPSTSAATATATSSSTTIGDGAVGFGDGEGVPRVRPGSSSAAAPTATPTARRGRRRRAARRPARRRRTARSRRRCRGSGSSRQTVTAQMADGTTSAASQDARCAAGAATATTTTSPRLGLLVGDHVDVDLPGAAAPSAAPMPSSKMRAHRDRRDVPSTSWVAFISRAKSSSALGTSSPTTVCTVAPRLAASSRTLPICGADTPDSPSPRTTCTTISSALDFDAMRDALRTKRLRLRRRR